MNNPVKTLAVRLAVVAGFVTLSAAAIAHEVPCPVCGMKVVQNTKSQDNEVVLRYGNKKIEYRCVYCVLSDSEKYKGDLVVYAPSEKKGEPVILTRTEGKWAAVKSVDGKLVPDEGAIFINSFENHAKCATLSRAFHTREAFDKYAVANGKKDAKALTLEELVTAVLKG